MSKEYGGQAVPDPLADDLVAFGTAVDPCQGVGGDEAPHGDREDVERCAGARLQVERPDPALLERAEIAAGRGTPLSTFVSEGRG